MSDSNITINIGEITIVYQQSPAKLTSEQQQQAYAESVEVDRKADEAQEEWHAALESADLVHTTGYPEEVITPLTSMQKHEHIMKLVRAAYDRQAAHRERLKNK